VSRHQTKQASMHAPRFGTQSKQSSKQPWLRMGFEPMPAPTRDVLWHRGRSNP